MSSPTVQLPEGSVARLWREAGELARDCLTTCLDEGAAPVIYLDVGAVRIETAEGRPPADRLAVTPAIRYALVLAARWCVGRAPPALEQLLEGARFRLCLAGNRTAELIVRLASCEEAALLFADRLETPGSDVLSPDEALRLAAVLRTLSARVGGAR